MDNTNKRPLILVSNDDGYLAKGVRILIKEMRKFGDVVAVCPDGGRSGQSMAITVNDALMPLRLPDYEGAEMWKVNGTPVDCVKVAMHMILGDRRPDLVVAGINHGANAAVNVLYSGTMGAVLEGCGFGLPAIGFSLTDHSPEADFEGCLPFVRRITEDVLRNGLPPEICLNVNIPDSAEPPTQMRVVRACRGRWNDEYKEYTDPHGRKFYWLSGEYVNEEPDNSDTDQWCLEHGIVSVVPVLLERTARVEGSLSWLKSLEGTGNQAVLNNAK